MKVIKRFAVLIMSFVLVLQSSVGVYATQTDVVSENTVSQNSYTEKQNFDIPCEESINRDTNKQIEMEEVTEDKAGSSFVTATNIATNISYQGKMSGTVLYQYYKFTVPKAGVVSLTVSHELYESPYYAWYFDLYDSSQKRIDTTKASSGYVQSTTGSQIGVSAGTYYLIVIAYKEYIDRTYTFKVNYEASDVWESEFNNSWITADPISTNMTYHGCVSYWESYDYYSFSISNPGVIWLELSHELYETAYSGWMIELYRVKGTSYEKMYDLYSTNGYATTKTGIDIGLEAGTYYVVVRENKEDQDRTYNFRVNYRESDEYEKEGNDSWLEADNINANAFYYGSTMNDYDVDYYKFYSPVSAYSKISLWHDTYDDGGYGWLIQLYDADKNLNSSFYSSSGYSNKRTYITPYLSEGYYYLVIREKDSNEGNNYLFNVALQPEKGAIEKIDNLKYKVKKHSTPTSNGEVECIGPTKKSIKSAKIESSISINGFKYDVTKIKSSAFKDCKKMTKITIGSKVKSIGSKAFYNCKKLKTITVKSKKITKVGKKAFKGIHKKAKIDVPKSKYKKYKKLFADKGQKLTVKIVK